jgi:hypothetical protein
METSLSSSSSSSSSSPSTSSSLSYLSTSSSSLPKVDLRPEWSEAVVFTLSHLNEKNEEEEIFLVLQKSETRWEVLLPKHCINLRGYRCLQLQFPSSSNSSPNSSSNFSETATFKKLPEEEKKFLQELFQRYSQKTIDGKFLRKLNLTGIPLTGNRLTDAEIMKYLTVKDLMPLRYDFPYHLFLKIQEELKDKYQIDSKSLLEDNSNHVYNLHLWLKKFSVRGTIQKKI